MRGGLGAAPFLFKGPGELHLAIFERAAGARGPGRVVVEREIAPPHRGRFGVAFETLEQKAHVEHRIHISGIGVERAGKASIASLARPLSSSTSARLYQAGA